MKRLIPLLAAIVLLAGLAGAALAADETLPRTGRVVFVAGGDLQVPAGEQADAVIVVGGNVRVDGTVNALVIIDGTATIRGATLETLAVINGSAELAAGTTVRGDVHRLGSTITRADGVEISGNIRDLSGDVAAFGLFMGAAALVLWLGFGLATLLVGLLVAGLAARQVRSATALISRETGLTILVGLLAIVVPPVAAVLLMVTVIGIPAGIGLLVVLWPAVAFIGYIVAAIWLGEWLLGRRSPEATPAERPYAAATLGLVVGFVIGLVPLVTAILSILGLGAVVLAAWRTLRGGLAQPRIQTQPAPIG
ncbi:MAG TPA: hypothetical protein VLA59_00665 [Patescibacteria group bacterium]|nr:hypothetical protein [Patescibacteria group bacterium]